VIGNTAARTRAKNQIPRGSLRACEPHGAWNRAEWDFQGSAVAYVRAARNNRNAMFSRSVVSVRYLIGASENSTCSRNAYLLALHVEFFFIFTSTMGRVLHLRAVECIDVSMYRCIDVSET